MKKQEINQKQAFILGEGDRWYDRNADLDLEQRVQGDLILKEIDRLNIKDKKCLEVGCAEGWRLAELNKRYSWECFGVDPSIKAIKYGESNYPNIKLTQGTADDLPYSDNSMSLVIIGFCLYLCDRNDLFKIANEIDRVLEDQGVLIILDFYSECHYKNEYTHLNGINSYKIDYSAMFTWNPIYQLISKIITDHNGETIVKDKNERIAICSLRKSIEDAYSEKPKF